MSSPETERQMDVGLPVCLFCMQAFTTAMHVCSCNKRQLQSMFRNVLFLAILLKTESATLGPKWALGVFKFI